MDSPEKQFEKLLDGLLDGTSTDAEQKQLASLLDAHRDLAPDFVDQLRTNGLLQWHCRAIKLPNFGNLGVDQSGSASSSNPPDIFGVIRFFATRWRFAAAAILLLAIGGLSVWYGSRLGGIQGAAAGKPGRTDVAHATGLDNVANAAVAEISFSQAVDWSGANTAVQEGCTAVHPGQLEMKSGTLTLKFRSGATMTATGDVSMRIISDMLVLLDRGQATAHVPHWAKGFTIKTNDVEVVDLGTQFGVMARHGGTTDVVVFEGQVDIKPTSGTGETDSQKRLSQGEGVRVSSQGSIDRIMEVRRDASQGQWTTDPSNSVDEELEWSESVFKSICDNIPSADQPSYYQIIPHGLADDCRAYVDMPSEWNGLTSDGLPGFLQHADYVMARNNYRYQKHFEMTVELAKPAVIYIFFDHRVSPPQWLTDQFENTGVDIGLDEGAWWPGDKRHSLGVGGGQSIDNVFSVWRRRCEQPEVLIFGSMGEKPGARAMYGIAAKPLD